MKYLFLFIILFAFSIHRHKCENNSSVNNGRTIITTQNVTSLPGAIDYKILKKPHNLLIGRCYPHFEVLHQEHIVVKNDGKSHVNANIRINVDGPVNITCVSILDEQEKENAYPVYSGGGVGQNFVAFNVLTRYGQGFHFFVQIFGMTTY